MAVGSGLVERWERHNVGLSDCPGKTSLFTCLSCDDDRRSITSPMLKEMAQTIQDGGGVIIDPQRTLVF